MFSIIRDDCGHGSRKCIMSFIYYLFFRNARQSRTMVPYFSYCLDLLLTDFKFLEHTSPTLSAVCFLNESNVGDDETKFSET